MSIVATPFLSYFQWRLDLPLSSFLADYTSAWLSPNGTGGTTIWLLSASYVHPPHLISARMGNLTSSDSQLTIWKQMFAITGTAMDSIAVHYGLGRHSFYLTDDQIQHRRKNIYLLLLVTHEPEQEVSNLSLYHDNYHACLHFCGMHSALRSVQTCLCVVDWKSFLYNLLAAHYKRLFWTLSVK